LFRREETEAWEAREGSGNGAGPADRAVTPVTERIARVHHFQVDAEAVVTPAAAVREVREGRAARVALAVRAGLAGKSPFVTNPDSPRLTLMPLHPVEMAGREGMEDLVVRAVLLDLRVQLDLRPPRLRDLNFCAPVPLAGTMAAIDLISDQVILGNREPLVPIRRSGDRQARHRW